MCSLQHPVSKRDLLQIYDALINMSLLAESITDMCRFFEAFWVTPVFLSLVLLALPTQDCTTSSKELNVLIKWFSCCPESFTTDKVNWHYSGQEEMKKLVRGFSQMNSLLMPQCSNAVGSVSPCAWGHHTVQSYSFPGWWRSVTTSHCRSKYSTGGGQHTLPQAGHPKSSWQWWSLRWGPGCKARNCLCPRHGSLEGLTMGMLCSTQGTVNLWQKRWAHVFTDGHWARTKHCLQKSRFQKQILRIVLIV